MQITPFLMFEGRAEEAMELYASLFEDARIESMVRWGPEGPDMEGKVQQAVLTIAGQRLIFFDSPPAHAFTFTPSISLYVTCDTEAQLDRCFEVLSEGGGVLMPLGEYPFSPKYAWVNDRFGVSWQLTLAA